MSAELFHAFDLDDELYCRRCGLPEANQRHDYQPKHRRTVQTPEHWREHFPYQPRHRDEP